VSPKIIASEVLLEALDRHQIHLSLEGCVAFGHQVSGACQRSAIAAALGTRALSLLAKH